MTVWIWESVLLALSIKQVCIFKHIFIIIYIIQYFLYASVSKIPAAIQGGVGHDLVNSFNGDSTVANTHVIKDALPITQTPFINYVRSCMYVYCYSHSVCIIT